MDDEVKHLTVAKVMAEGRALIAEADMRMDDAAEHRARAERYQTQINELIEWEKQYGP